MQKFWMMAAVFLIAGMLQGEELIENGDFSKERNHWKISAKDEITQENPIAGGPFLLKINLNERSWSTIEQELKLSSNPPSAIAIKIEVQGSTDFKAQEKSKEYSDVDFPMGGSYGWSALVFPKSDCLIIIQNTSGWEYRPVKLNLGQWQTIHAECKKLPGKKAMITLCFPPGTGSVMIKSVSVDLAKSQ